MGSALLAIPFTSHIIQSIVYLPLWNGAALIFTQLNLKSLGSYKLLGGGLQSCLKEPTVDCCLKVTRYKQQPPESQSLLARPLEVALKENINVVHFEQLNQQQWLWEDSHLVPLLHIIPGLSVWFLNAGP